MYASLLPDLVGIKVSPAASIPIAARAGFTGLDVRVNEYAEEIERLGVEAFRDAMAAAGLRPGYCSLTTNKMNVPDLDWAQAMAVLPFRAEIAKAIGFKRATSVVVPFDDELSPADNFRRHADRAREAADILAPFGISFGMEYISPKTRWHGKPNPFIRDLTGMMELIDAVDRPNVGVMLDCFHWHLAGETTDDLRRLPPERIVAVHVNDLVADRPEDEQTVMERELPGATGLIDLPAFISTLAEIGYDGPVTAEPTHPRWKVTPADDAAAQTAESILSFLQPVR